ncbi:MAG: glycosyltransferase family 4 protein, partial [Chloroflexota bacterium]
MNARPSLRVAHVTATFPPYWGGTGNVAWHNAHQMAQRGHAVHVLTADLGGEALAPDGVHVHRLRPLLRAGNAPVLPALLPALRGFDLIHLHYPFFFGAEAVWAASRLYRTPYVLTYHNALIGDGLRAPLFRAWERVLGTVVLSGADRVLAVSLDHAAAQSWFAGCAGRRCAELPNGVDTERFHPAVDGRWVRERFGIDSRTPLVLYAAALDRAHHFKGLHRLLDALRQLQIQQSDLALLIVGDGDQRGAYEAQVDALGLRPTIRFAGSVRQSDLPPYFAAADLLVLPTSPPESFGMVLIEAMACATPVIASDIPGVREVVRSTGGGRLVPPGDVDALAQAIGDL